MFYYKLIAKIKNSVIYSGWPCSLCFSILFALSCDGQICQIIDPSDFERDQILGPG